MEKSIQKRANEWLLGDDTGSSSKMLCAHMMGLNPASNTPPSDASDRGRCIRLLELIPEWTDRLDEMKKYPSRKYLAISGTGTEVREEGWTEQIDLIREEMK